MVRTIDMNDQFINIAVLPSELEVLQCVCELTSMLYSGCDKDQRRIIEHYTKGKINLEEVKESADHWKFQIRRILEQAQHEQNSLTGG